MWLFEEKISHLVMMEGFKGFQVIIGYLYEQSKSPKNFQRCKKNFIGTSWLVLDTWKFVQKCNYFHFLKISFRFTIVRIISIIFYEKLSRIRNKQLANENNKNTCGARKFV